MKDTQIFLSGGMTGLTSDEFLKWRIDFKKYIYEYNELVDCYIPPHYYMISNNDDLEREAMKFQIHRLRNSNIVVAKFDVDKPSIGTAMEVMLAKELHIPIVGICKDKVRLHPWLKECCIIVCDDVEDAVEYVNDFLLN